MGGEVTGKLHVVNYFAYPVNQIAHNYPYAHWKISTTIIKGLNWVGYEFADSFMILTYLYSII